MITLKEAKEIALSKITRNGLLLKDNPPMIIDESTREYEYGWLFFYDSKAYLEKEQEHSNYVGNAPVLVDKMDGEVIYIGLSLSGLDDKVYDVFLNKGYTNHE